MSEGDIRRAAEQQVNQEVKEGTYKLIQEWIVNHTNNRDTFNSKSDRSTDHGISMDLSSVPRHCFEASIQLDAAKRERQGEGGKKGGREEGRERRGHTKLVVPSIGLLSARSPAPAGLSLLDYTLVIQIRRWR